MNADGWVEVRRDRATFRVWADGLRVDALFEEEWRTLPVYRTPSGYRKVHRYGGHNVAWLVLEAFAGPRPAGLVANHKNGIKADDRAENLEWVTVLENNLHAIRTGLTQRKKRHKNRTDPEGYVTKS